MVSSLLYLVAVLCAFLTSNTASGFTLPEFALQHRSNVSPNGIPYHLDRKDAVIDDIEGTKVSIDGESSDAVSGIISISSDQIAAATSIRPASLTSLPNSIALGVAGDTTIYLTGPTTIPGVFTFGTPTGNSVAFPTSTTAYTPPSEPFAIPTSQNSRRFPTSPITTFATPTFVFSQTVIVTETITTLFVIDPTRTSTILGYNLVATVSTITSVGYACSSTNAPPSTASEVILSGISKLPLLLELAQS
jgi:hypothetical protein